MTGILRPLSRILFCVMTLAALATSPLGMQQAPSLEEARLAALSIYGISPADICGTGDSSGTHTHCESCLTQALTSPAKEIALLSAIARRFDTIPPRNTPPTGRSAPGQHPIRAPPLVWPFI